LGEIFCRSRSPLVVPEGWLTTVMSAPMRVSQNGEIDCLTDTEAAPLPWALDDHDASSLAAPFEAARPLAEGRFSVEASTLSWLQSSLSMSTSFRMSSSFFSGAGSAASSASSVSSRAGGDCASAFAEPNAKRAASASSRHCPIDVLNCMTPPGSSRTYMRSFWRKIVAGPFGARPKLDDIRLKCSVIESLPLPTGER